MEDKEQVEEQVCVCEEYHLIDVELWLASGHFSVAGAELADKVVAVKNEHTVTFLLPTEELAAVKQCEQKREEQIWFMSLQRIRIVFKVFCEAQEKSGVSLTSSAVAGGVGVATIFIISWR